MPMTYEEYIKGSSLDTSVVSTVKAGSEPPIVDRLNPMSGNTIQAPLGTSTPMIDRQESEGLLPDHTFFGSAPISDERELPEFIQSSSKGIEEMVAGAALQVRGVATRFPAILAQEFSDIVGDNAEQFPGISGEVVAYMDDIADDLSVSLMDDYRQIVAEYDWAFDEDGERSFMFNLGSGGASLVEALGITLITRSPKAAAAFFGALQQTDTYAKAIDAGKSPKEALMIANSTGLSMGLLELAGIQMLMKTMGTPAKRALQRAVEGMVTEGIQEGTQEASVIGIENITGVDDVGLAEGVSQIGESVLIGGILGGVAGPVGGGISDIAGRRQVRSGALDQNVVDQLMREIEGSIRNTITTEKEAFKDSRLENPKTESGKRLRMLQDKISSIVQSQLSGQEFGNVFKTTAQQEEYVKGIASQMAVATKAESQVIQASKLRDIQSDTKKLSGIQKELEDSGAQVVEKYAEKFDQTDKRHKYLKSLEGKSISEALIGMRKELRGLKKEQDQALGEELFDINAEVRSLEDTIQDFEAIDSDQMEGFDDNKAFRDGLEGLPEYRKIAQRSKDIEADIQAKEAEYREWSERNDSSEIFDFINNERISVPGQALRKITRDASIKSFMKGLNSGQKKSQAFFVDVIGSVERLIKSMPVFKGKVLGKDSKKKILDELNKRKDKLITKKLSEADVEEQIDAIADAIEDIIQVAKNMTSKEAYKAHRKTLKKTLSKQGKTKDIDLDIDLNNALDTMNAMLNSRSGFESVYEKFDQEYGNMYRPVIDSFYQLLSQEQEGTVSVDELAESYALTLDGVEYLVNYGYIPDASYIARAAELEAAKIAVSRGNEVGSENRLRKARKGKRYFVQDTFFNQYFETLNTLWVKLGLQNIRAFDLTKSDMDYRNGKIRWSSRLKDMRDKLGFNQKDMESWSSIESEQDYTLQKENGETVVYHLTKGQVMQRVMNLRNKKQRAQAMDEKGTGYTEQFIAELEGSLSTNEKKFIDESLKIYKELYDEISPVYRELFLMDMPLIENYSPAPRKQKGRGDISVNDITFLGPNGLAIPSFTQKRTDTSLDFMDIGIAETMSHYIDSAMYFTNYQKKISDINAIIRDEKVRAEVIRNIGKRGYDRLKDHIDYIKDMPTRQSQSRGEMWNYFNKVYIVNKLMFKPNQIFKQITSFAGILEDVPTSYVIKNLHKAFNPLSVKRWRSILRDSETIKNRSEHIDADYNALLDNETIGLFSDQNRWVRLGMKPTVIGDVGAIYVGGGMYYDYLTQVQGKTKKEALDIVTRKAEGSQQSSLPSNMSLLQKNQDPFARTIRMFSSSAIALMNMQMQAFAKYRNGEITRTELFKNLAIYQFAVPAMYSLVAGQISFDDEDELALGLIHAGLKGNFGAVPIMGEGLDAVTIQAINSMTDAELTSYGVRDIENPLGEFFKITMKGMKAVNGEEEFTEQEVLEVVFEVMDSVSRLGSENIFNGISGAIEVADEGSAEGLLRAFGYSETAAKTMTRNK
jgi:hypothetical protein